MHQKNYSVDVIVPIYKGFEQTKSCIESTLKSLPTWARLILINDCSPDEKIRDLLNNYKKNPAIIVLENSENLGFVQTVNVGMKYSIDRDVLLLNSDVEVSELNWLERITDCAYYSNNVASVTPYSNNATICSFPNFCEDNEIFLNKTVTEIDSVFAEVNSSEPPIEIPTGVGFCMFIRRKALNQIGFFDVETFGKGYGEENDWCQRAIKAGFVNYHCLNVFAYHKGGVSFAEEGDERKSNALRLLLNLHPNYTNDVSLFIEKDPGAINRIKVLINFIRTSPKKNILFVSHSFQGGTEQHINELITAFEKEANMILLKPDTGCLVASFFIGNSNIRQSLNLRSEAEIIESFLCSLNIDRVHIHHTMGVSSKLFEIFKKNKLDFDITIHDYYLVNGNPTLTDSSGNFICENNSEVYSKNICKLPPEISIEDFKIENENLLKQAKRIIFPSKDTFARFSKFFPFINAQSIIAYHPDINPDLIRDDIKLFQHGNKKKMKVLVLGALSLEKGADELEAVAKANKKNIEFHLLGYAYRHLEAVITHGKYNNNLIDDKINEIEPDFIWFPAKWPETYSYTFSSALKSRYMIVCPSIGAFTERSKGKEGVILIKPKLSSNELIELWFSIFNGVNINHFLSCDVGPDTTEIPLNKNFYANDYLKYTKKSSDIKNLIKMDKLLFLQDPISTLKISGYKYRVYRMLLMFAQKPIISKLIRILPYEFKFKIKKILKREL